MELDKKNIIVQSPPNEAQHPRVDFVLDDFEAAIWQKGYEVIVEKALRCPCFSKGGGANIACLNCGGSGWFFINPFQTRALIHSINRSTQYKDWSELNLGTVSVTVRKLDEITYMDRITLLDVTSVYSEVLFPIYNENSLFSYFIYDKVKSIENIFFYVADNLPLEPMVPEDYVFDQGKIVFAAKFKDYSNFTVTVRYKHNVQFNVLDLPREIMSSTRKNDFSGYEERSDFPIHAVARRSHFVLSRENFAGNLIFDNSQ